MSKAEEFYHREGAEITDFMQLTPTGIKTDYKRIFEFAEAYHQSRVKAISDDKEKITIAIRNQEGTKKGMNFIKAIAWHDGFSYLKNKLLKQ